MPVFLNRLDAPLYDGRRGQRAVEQFLVGLRPSLPRRLFPVNLIRPGIGTADRVAMRGVELAPGDKGLGALIGPDRVDVGLAQIVHRLEHLGIALGVREADVGVSMLVTVAPHGSGDTFTIKTLKSIIERQARWVEDDLVRLGLVKK